jgi:glycosyltransferase involved in cell wall biosynthesis
MKYVNIIKIKSFLIVLNCLSYNLNIVSYVKNLISYLSLQNEIKEIEQYLKMCEDLKIIKRFKKLNHIKISVISPIFNRESFIIKFLNSIQFQNFNDIEIIFVDDCSTDNSAMIIEDYKNKDKRILLIKNKKNKGTFVARNIGVLYGKGKYIIIPDIDDILSKNIIRFCYNKAEKYNYEVIRFSTYKGKAKIYFEKYILKLGNKAVYYPKISNIIFYGFGELEMADYFISNKFIKTETYIKALNSLNNYYLNMYNIYMEDQIMNFIIHLNAKSLYFTTKVGYYYLKTEASITKNTKKMAKLDTKFIFIYFKILFEYSKNNKYEKDMFNLLFTNINKSYNIKNLLLGLSSKDDLYFYYYIINIYLNCKYITDENKYYLQCFKSIIENKLLSKKIF